MRDRTRIDHFNLTNSKGVRWGWELWVQPEEREEIHIEFDKIWMAGKNRDQMMTDSYQIDMFIGDAEDLIRCLEEAIEKAHELREPVTK